MLGEILVGLRSGRGLSQEQLAERSGISVRAIGEIERGATRRPQRGTLRALADSLGLTGEERTVSDETVEALFRAAQDWGLNGARVQLWDDLGDNQLNQRWTETTW
ncbi:helix-turn-helix domain-containing protein [Kibdelosporangium lantanae]|uniref:Helix-turn-helix domain-containing protein n=1 Tax=Kibdelosporangium lantanae TaxID=1497396 RepID=A0ABW3MEJ0_9PSEU